jgi:hypothetical protein
MRFNHASSELIGVEDNVSRAEPALQQLPDSGVSAASTQQHD